MPPTSPSLLLGPAVRAGGPALREALGAARELVLAERREAGGLATARALAGLLDEVVRRFTEHFAPRAGGFAVLAIGGYGRGDLCPFSDVDLVVVATRRIAAVQEFTAALGRLLWDAGVEANLTLRTPGAARRAMERDHTLASSLLDRRFLAGDEGVAERFETAAVAPFLEGRGPWLADRKCDEARERRRTRGACPLGLEPDVKEAAGGLRDMHLLRWLDLAAGAPPGAGLLPGTDPEAARPLEEAYGVLLGHRIELHLHAGRRQDLLDLATQAELVDVLDPGGGEPPALRHLAAHRPFFEAARRVARACERVLGTEPAPGAAPADDRASFLALLDGSASPVPALRALDARDRLPGLVPGWGDLVALPQADPYHAWTVDEHTLRAMEVFEDLRAGRGPLGERFAAEAASVRNLRVLRLALLLHDVGKVKGSRDHGRRGAALLGGLLDGFGLSPAETRVLLHLVEIHTRLGEASAFAVRGDDGPVERLAAEAGDRDTLRSLLLLTAADIGGVGRGAWTAWRAAQLLDFHDRVARRLEGAPEEAPDLGTALVALLPRDRWDEAAALLGRAPRRYRAGVSPERARVHLELLRGMETRRGAPVAAAADRTGAIDLLVAAGDRSHLFADLAGSLTLLGLDILAADAFTLEGGVALDAFTVRAPVGDVRAAVAALERAAADGRGVEGAVRRFARRIPAGSAPPPGGSVEVRRVDAGDGAAAEFRVESPDRPGLLHDLARAVSVAGWDLEQVRVATLGPRALDAFRVTRDGRAPDPGEESERLIAALRDAALRGIDERLL